MTKKTTKTNKKNSTRNVTNKSTNNRKNNGQVKQKRRKEEKIKYFLMLLSIFLLGILLIFSAYAWISTSLNVKIKTFNMVVTKNEGLTISFDAVNYDYSIELSEKIIVDDLVNTYPNNLSQWSANGLIPVSSPGITNKNSYFFDIFASSGVHYKNKRDTIGRINTNQIYENKVRRYNRFIAFDIFLKNDTGSPISDNLYIEETSEILMESTSEEMRGLLNSVRVGFVKVGSLPLTADSTAVQNIQCNNNCESIIYEPYSKEHTNMSIERSEKYGINLENGVEFPTYANIKKIGPNPIKVEDTISGSPNLDLEYFALQNTMKDGDLNRPLFQIPNGITKARVYLWIEGQDIDSLETNSEGADLSISLGLVKDTQGYDAFND